MEKYCFFVQLKPVGNMCNLECGYCYTKPCLSYEKVMSEKILECVIRKSLWQDYLFPTFSWHGGEPTLVGYDFFKQAMNLMEKYRQPKQIVRNLIQTNATLITPQLVKLFKKYNFGVSVSLDGPKDIHGINRRTANGENSFERVMQGIKMLRVSGINASVICTVSKKTLPFAVKTFNFLVSKGFKNLSYSPVFDSVGEDEFSVTNDEWFNYLRTVFYEWFKMRDPAIQIRELNEVIAWMSRKPLSFCSSSRTCPYWISIAPDGDIRSCEYQRNQYYYGNITKINFSNISLTNAHQEFRKAENVIPLKCQKCKFFEMCGNGCPRMRVKNGKISMDGLYAFCKQRQNVFHEIEKVFKIVLIEGGGKQ